jgi:hypothetical protein
MVQKKTLMHGKGKYYNKKEDTKLAREKESLGSFLKQAYLLGRWNPKFVLQTAWYLNKSPTCEFFRLI